MRSALNLILTMTCSVAALHGQSLDLRSPDGTITATLHESEQGPYLSIVVDGALLLDHIPVGLVLADETVYGPGMKRTLDRVTEHDEAYRRPYRPHIEMRDRYNLLTTAFAHPERPDRRFELLVRSYDDGVALRYRIPGDGETIQLAGERTAFSFAGDPLVYALPVAGFGTSYEGHYETKRLAQLDANLIGLPITFQHDTGHFSAITEAHLDDYAGMFLVPGDAGRKHLGTRLARRGQGPAVKRIAPFESPWRVIMLGRRAGDLIETDIVPRLNPPCAIDDTSWIRPGKVVWPWWTKRMVTGVDFAGGVNTRTMMHYIDFAAENGFDGIVLDEGWSWWANVPGPDGKPRRLTDITRPVHSLDFDALLAYARERNVRLWLWLTWGHAEAQMAEAFALYEKWGIAGVKVDFMQREDQWMVNWYHKVAREAARHRLMVNMHGAYKPTGIRRTWPNMITREAVIGAEYNKWSHKATPQHNVMIPFTRMLAGPMDYTPGGMDVVMPEHFRPRDDGPMVMGTTCHELAKYVIYDCPLQTLADYPGNYRGHPALPFLRTVPTVWDETKVLEGHPGHYIVMARRHDDEWYLAAMNASNTFGDGIERGRSLVLPLNFLPDDTTYEATIITDGDRAATNPRQCEIATRPLTRRHTLRITMHEFGGFVARLSPE